MGKSGLLRHADVRAALRLVGECRDLGYDPPAWGRHMFAGLCRLTGARAGNGGEVRLVRPARRLKGIAYFDAGLEPWEHDRYASFLRTYGVEQHPIAGRSTVWPAAAPRPGRLSTKTRRQLVPDGQWYRSVAYSDCHRGAKSGSPMERCRRMVLNRPSAVRSSVEVRQWSIPITRWQSE
jgi:hypothetical protein